MLADAGPRRFPCRRARCLPMCASGETDAMSCLSLRPTVNRCCASGWSEPIRRSLEDQLCISVQDCSLLHNPAKLTGLVPRRRALPCGRATPTECDKDVVSMSAAQAQSLSLTQFMDDPIHFFGQSYTRMHSVPRDELEELQRRAMGIRFQQHYDGIDMVRKVAG